MNHSENNIHDLLTYLESLATCEPKLSGEVSKKVLELLSECWPVLSGSDDQSTTPDKVCRSENLKWKSPILSFQLERHGGTVKGSTRAALHHWEVNLEKGTATIAKTGSRQLQKQDLRMDTKVLARETADRILNGENHFSLKWSGDRSNVVLAIGEIIPETNAKTTSDRRKRYKQQLDSIMSECGWSRHDQGNKVGFACSANIEI